MDKDLKDAEERQAHRRAIVEKVAQNMLGIPTLRERGRDSLDFHEVSVWDLERALELAFIRGQQQATNDIEKMIAP